MSKVGSFKDLIVYQKAISLRWRFLKYSKNFLKKTYSLTDQIRRSSRSVTSCICRIMGKRRYEKAFINKLTDSLGEEYETEDGSITLMIASILNQETHARLLK